MLARGSITGELDLGLFLERARAAEATLGVAYHGDRFPKLSGIEARGVEAQVPGLCPTCAQARAAFERELGECVGWLRTRRR